MKLFLILGLLFWSSATEASFRVPSQLVDALRSCLTTEGVDTTATLFEYDPSPDSTYAFYNYQWEVLLPQKYPAAHFVVRSVQDVQAGVRCAKPLGIPLVPKGGGHSYEKYSYGEDETAVVVDMQKLDELSVERMEPNAVAGVYTRTRTVPVARIKIGAGALLAHVAWPLYSRHNLVTPHGTCPTVGVAGLALGGGYGYLSRLYGLTTDNVLEMEVVTASGDLLIVNNRTNQDLFWALKGAGPGTYGIVTSFTLKGYEPPRQVAFGYATYPLGIFPLVLESWQQFLYMHYPRELNTKLIVRNEQVVLEVFEVQLEPDEDEDVLARVREFIRSFPYTLNTKFEMYNYPDFLMKTMHAEAYGVTNPEGFANLTRHSQVPKLFKAKSFFGSTSATEDGKADLLRLLEAIPSPADIIIELYALGGQINDPEAYSESSFMHRSQALYLAQAFYEVRPESSDAPSTQDVEASLAWLRQFFTVASSVLGGEYSYQNYVDAELENYLERYFGWHLARLSQIKTVVDPDNYFSHPQSIPPLTR